MLTKFEPSNLIKKANKTPNRNNPPRQNTFLTTTKTGSQIHLEDPQEKSTLCQRVLQLRKRRYVRISDIKVIFDVTKSLSISD